MDSASESGNIYGDPIAANAFALRDEWALSAVGNDRSFRGDIRIGGTVVPVGPVMESLPIQLLVSVRLTLPAERLAMRDLSLLSVRWTTVEWRPRFEPVPETSRVKLGLRFADPRHALRPISLCRPPFCRRKMGLAALAIVLLLPELAGCRGVGRFGESRQSIAARRLSRQGLKSMRQGDWTVAETLFTEALDVSGSNDAAHRGLSESLWQRGQRAEAIEHLEKAVQLSAGDPKHMQRLGRMYLEVGRVDEATRQCQIALDSDREWGALWALWGDCQSARGETDEALAAYHRALSLQPDYPYVQMRTAEIYHQQKRYDRLLATLDRFRESAIGANEVDGLVHPGSADLLRGIAMRELGRVDEAVQSFIASAEKNPTDATSRLQLASIAVEAGQPEIAQTWLVQATRLDPNAARDAGWKTESRMMAGQNVGTSASRMSTPPDINQPSASIAVQPDGTQPWSLK